MKKQICLLLISFFAVSLFAKNGLMCGTKKINVVKTQWFDIVYSEECEAGAKILYKEADAMYEEIAGLYGVTPNFRMPVVLCSNQENYNAYWSNAYSNHIVMYVTSSPESLLVFSDNFLSCFRHELTHAVSYNLKGPFWSALGKVFGEPFYLPGLLITSGRAEGATLTSESMRGEGRLNDEYSLQMIKQAKLENQFPAYAHVQGACDIYPKGSYYNFNGAFDQWMQEQYGMDKYAEYWYRMVNSKDLLFIGATFKKVYGVKVNDAWARFLEDFDVPNIPVDPVEAGLVKDFFVSDNPFYSKQNKAGALYSEISAGKTGVIYTDNNTSSVYFVSNEKLNESQIKPKKLFTLARLQTAQISADGRFIASDFISENYANEKYKIQIYDTQTKHTFVLPGTGKKFASIIQKNDDYYLVYQKFNGLDISVEIAEIQFEKDKIKAVNPVKEIKCRQNEVPYSFVDLQNGTFAYICKTGLISSIYLCDLDGKITSQFTGPKDRMTIKDLSFSAQDNALYFSWTEPKSMPRLGRFFIEAQRFSLSEEDFSGGVYSPVAVNNQLIYAGNFFRENRIFTRDIDKYSFVDFDAEEAVSLAEFVASHDYSSVILDPQKYKRTDFLKGLWVPYSGLQSRAFNPEHTNSYPMLLGLTLYNSNVWDGDVFEASIGYGTPTKSIGIGTTYSSGTNTSLFKYYIKDFAEIDFYKGFKQFEIEGGLSSSVTTGKHSAISLSNTAFFHNGRTNDNSYDGGYFSVLKAVGKAVSTDLTNYMYFADGLSLTYSNFIKSGVGKYEKFGFGVNTTLSYIYNGAETGEIYQKGLDLGVNALIYIPKLLPIINKRGFVTSLPTKINLNLFSTSIMENSISLLNTFIPISDPKRFTDYDLASLCAETVLFEMDIHKNLLFFYFHDIRLSFDYMCGIANSPETFSQNWKISHIPEYSEMLSNGELKFSGYPYLKLTLGCSTTGKKYTKKSYVCLKFGIEGLGTETIAPKFDLYFDSGF